MEELTSATRREKEIKGLMLEKGKKNCVYLQMTKAYGYKIIGNLHKNCQNKYMNLARLQDTGSAP